MREQNNLMDQLVWLHFQKLRIQEKKDKHPGFITQYDNNQEVEYVSQSTFGSTTYSVVDSSNI